MDTAVQVISDWTPSVTPSSTSLSTITATNTAGLMSTLLSAASIITTATARDDLVEYSQMIRGAKASLAIISAQDVLETATAESVQAQATDVILNNSLNLEDLYWEMNEYTYDLVRSANIIFLALFSLIVLYDLIFAVMARYDWFNITFLCGYVCELIGYIARVMSFNDTSNEDKYLAQFVCLTIAPAFIMAGIYFVFAQLVVIHGRKYAVLRPLWYSYIFITWDVMSLVIQAIGGGIASSADDKDTSDIGVNILIAGVCIQIAGMTSFVVLFMITLNRFYFKDRKLIVTSDPLNKWSIGSFVKFLVNTKSANLFKINYLDRFYNQTPVFFNIRHNNKILPYFPFAILLSVAVIYVRCVFRVVELCQGWHGYLMNHEVYTFVLDSAMVVICGLIYFPFHPYWVFGKKNVIDSKAIRNNLDEKGEIGDSKGSGSYEESFSDLLLRH